jgi:hypothetical protein
LLSATIIPALVQARTVVTPALSAKASSRAALAARPGRPSR